MKVIILIFFTLASEFALSQGFLRTEGAKIVDASGREVKLNGVNLGGWLLWEGWIWGGGLHKESRVYEQIEKLTSKEFAIKFRRSVYDNFLSKEDIAEIASLGLNSVRIPIHYKLLYNEHSKPNLDFTYLDSLIAWCKASNIYVILDLHALPGGQSPLFTADPDKIKLWDSEENRSLSIDIWKKIAEKYKNEPIIAGFDLINEPNFKKDKGLLALYKNLIREIRVIDDRHIIIVEGNKYAHSFSFFESGIDSNVVYSFHYYPWFSGTKGRIKKLNKYANFAKKLNAPFWCGEWGVDQPDDLKEIHGLLMDDKFNFCGNSFWTWKKAFKKNLPAPKNFHVSNDLKRVLKGKQPKSKESAEDILLGFIESLSYEKATSDVNLKNLLSTKPM